MSQVSVREKEIAEDSQSSSFRFGTFDGTVCGISPLIFWYWNILRFELVGLLLSPPGVGGAAGSAGMAVDDSQVMVGCSEEYVGVSGSNSS